MVGDIHAESESASVGTGLCSRANARHPPKKRGPREEETVANFFSSLGLVRIGLVRICVMSRARQIWLLASLLCTTGAVVQLQSCVALNCPVRAWISGSLTAAQPRVVHRLGGEVLDALGRPWSIDQDAVVESEAPIAVRVRFPFANSPIAVVRHAQERVRPRAVSEACPPGAHCCVDASGLAVVRWLVRNVTAYRVYALASDPELYPWSPPRVLFNGSSVVALSSSQWRPWVPLLDDTSAAMRLLCPDDGGSCFLVPARYIGSTQQLIGMTDAEYAATLDVCATPVGWCTRVASLSPTWDQFAPFRGATAARIGSCTGRINDTQFALETECAAWRVDYAVALDVSAFARPLFGLPVVARTAVLPSSRSEPNRIHVVLHVRNAGTAPSDFLVAIDSCDDNAGFAPAFPARMVRVASQRTEAVHLTLLHATRNASAPVHCVASVSSFGVRHVQAHVQWHPRVSASQAPPVDCFVLYGGTRNWFNASSGQCMEVTRCTAADQLYDPVTNACLSPQQMAAIPVDDSPLLPSIITEEDVAASAFHNNSAANCTACTPSVLVPSTGDAALSSYGIVFFVVLVIIIALVVLCVTSCACKAHRRRQRRLHAERMDALHTTQLHQSWSASTALHVPAASSMLAQNSLNFALPASSSAVAAVAAPPVTNNLYSSGLISLMRIK